MIVVFKHYRPKYGDWDFVKVDMEHGLMLAIGNSGSTSVDLTCDLDIFVKNAKELEKVCARIGGTATPGALYGARIEDKTWATT